MIKRIFRKIKAKITGEKTVEELVKHGLVLGKNVSIQKDVSFDYGHCWLISIGDNCTLAPRVHILAHDASTIRHIGYAKIGRVTIGENTFIGAGTIILPGVTIGENVIIGAGSVVSKDIPDNTVAVGNPATMVSSTSAYLEKHKGNINVRPTYTRDWTTNGGITEKQKKQMISDLESVTIGYTE
ncbi:MULTISPECIES: DapH/DapD/GlmU-related protein [Bacillus cereus group]|uniref:DapH/DapD/GlmU-related protein n=1 Tax=Bacillus cereus group TaxID=86661 RepID=UPI0011215213|nr:MULTISPECIES: DapH/DapD/GlmU-related protein [Bacillus cereus group]MDW3038824.1 DapH/DapD/GlmU-related protein [Bacillus pacificus]TNP03307.1 acyltransferase [Bacillus pacificus]